MIDINVNDTPINLIDDVTAQWVESNSDDYDFLSLQDYPEEVRQPEGSQQENPEAPPEAPRSPFAEQPPPAQTLHQKWTSSQTSGSTRHLNPSQCSS
eukprot:m.184517 g.184517  ORF g.184517 m.184517 type:complete len:97 (+) comp39324_c0_seq5:903-1193(+)